MSDKCDLDSYEHLQILGQGAFGRVVLVQNKKKKGEYRALKMLSKFQLIRTKQVEHARSERSLQLTLKHPFLVELFCSAQDPTSLYLLMEFVCGGEMFVHLRSADRFSNNMSQFYSAEVMLGLEYCHSKLIAYRDLKPENLLIDYKGHVKLTDFGFAKVVESRTYTLCGTPEYLAPEIILNQGHNFAADWWSFGVLVYEFLCGCTPFDSDHPPKIYEKIVSGEIKFPKNIVLDPAAQDLILSLLTRDLTKRLGNLRNKTLDIRKHKWYASIDWKDLEDLRIKPPFTPEVSGPGDASNFDEFDEEDYDTDWKSNYRPITDAEQKLFEEF